MVRIFLVILLVFVSGGAIASVIRGTVTTDENARLSYATIYVTQTGTGTVTNENGDYEINLPPGHYDLVYQFLGYETVVRSVELGEEPLVIDVVLKTQVTVLQSVTVRAGKEDPAYTIMRKAIAKATYHRNQLDAYSARVYIKGAGKLTDYPWLAKKALEKEGVEKNRVFISESVSEIKYTRPAKFEEKVISIRSDGKDNNTSPNQFIFGSFYEPEVGGTVSPLSPKAFSYYRFEYQGTFQDRQFAISRIKVTPRSRGDNVVEGMLYIVEDWWSIHSLNLQTTKLGINIKINSMYAPVEDKVWLPVSFRFGIDGKVFGFAFEYQYLATISNYVIELNPELYVENDEMQVIDEKLEKEQAKQIEETLGSDAKDLQDRLSSGKEITRKELRTLAKEYEKQEREAQKEPEVISDVTFTIDSTAYKHDSVYWADIRPVPLTREEIAGYQKADSLAEVQRKRDEGDTLKDSRHKGFQPWDILIGDHYELGDHSNFKIHPINGGFNTVEGWNLIYRLSYGIVLQDTNRTRFTISPTFRYGFSREKFNGHMRIGLRNKNYHLLVDGGRYVDQLNTDDPIWPLVNTFTTLFLEKNLMKLYEQDYLDVEYGRKLTPFLSTELKLSWSKRRELFNTSSWKLINNKNIEDYTPNRPENLEVDDTGFPENTAFIGSVNVVARPWLKYRIRNGVKYEIESSSPRLGLTYRKGFDGLLDSDVSFDYLELNIRHSFDIGVRGKMTYAFGAGTFLNREKLYFMDYKHFPGNQTPFSTNDPVGGFRLLDYYLYSTSDRYWSASAYYQFRKFAVTRIPIVRMTGIRENLFINYLNAPTSDNYFEAGYSIDGILRLFRLEAVAAFQDGQYIDYGFRIGITTNVQFEFNDD